VTGFAMPKYFNIAYDKEQAQILLDLDPLKVFINFL
jgi:hypothetical protein